jgi:hypothetical protein
MDRSGHRRSAPGSEVSSCRPHAEAKVIPVRPVLASLNAHGAHHRGVAPRKDQVLLQLVPWRVAAIAPHGYEITPESRRMRGRSAWTYAHTDCRVSFTESVVGKSVVRPLTTGKSDSAVNKVPVVAPRRAAQPER